MESRLCEQGTSEFCDFGVASLRKTVASLRKTRNYSLERKNKTIHQS